MKALITGAYGFVGRYLARELSDAGYDVTGADLAAEAEHYRSGPAYQGLPTGTAYKGCDLLSEADVGGLLKGSTPDVIFHLAAKSSGGLSFKEPRSTIETNIMGFVNLLEAVRRHSDASRVIAVGSCDEYGKKGPGLMPLSEDASVEPVNPYAGSKAAQTILALQYSRAFDLDVIATRSFNHTGPGQTSTFVLPSFARQCALIKEEKAEPVIRTGDLGIVRDFLDVRDVVRAYRMLAEKGLSGRVYNVCSGEGLILRDALEMIIEEAAIDVEVERDPSLVRPVDVPVFTGENFRLVDDTGWKREIQESKMISDLLKYWINKKGD